MWEGQAEMGINSGQKSVKKVWKIQAEMGINLGQKSLADSVNQCRAMQWVDAVLHDSRNCRGLADKFKIK